MLKTSSKDQFSFPEHLINDLFQTYHTLALRVQEDLALLADQPSSSLIMGQAYSESLDLKYPIVQSSEYQTDIDRF